jgi:hypothetical protein
MRGRKRRRTGNETGETRTSPRFPPGHGARHLKPAKPPPADVTVNADQAMSQKPSPLRSLAMTTVRARCFPSGWMTIWTRTIRSGRPARHDIVNGW